MCNKIIFNSTVRSIKDCSSTWQPVMDFFSQHSSDLGIFFPYLTTGGKKEHGVKFTSKERVYTGAARHPFSLWAGLTACNTHNSQLATLSCKLQEASLPRETFEKARHRIQNSYISKFGPSSL